MGSSTRRATPDWGSRDTVTILATYSILSNLVDGKRVLDLACGEGYGSWLLMEWGAASVTGIDADVAAVETAKKHLARPNLHFLVNNPAEDTSFLASGSFDVVVSPRLERVQDIEKHLRSVRRLASRGALLVISCPNFSIDYPECILSDSHQVRKFSEEEFRKTSEDALGKASSWLSLLPVTGLKNLQTFPPKSSDSVEKSSIEFSQTKIFTAKQTSELSLKHKEALRWTGIWGAVEVPRLAELIQMDSEKYSEEFLFDSMIKTSPVFTLQAEISRLRASLRITMEEKRILEASHPWIQIQKHGATIAKHLRQLDKAITQIAKGTIPIELHQRVYLALKKLRLR